MGDLVPALCSVTFRSLAAGRIVELAAAAGCRAIEWGGDVHVPPGAIELADSIAASTRAAGLVPASYGTYFAAGSSRSVRGQPAVDPDALIDTARALGARGVRVWAGTSSSRKADNAVRNAVASALRDLTERAAKKDLAVSLEYHIGTLTDNAPSTLDLLEQVGATNLFTHWQPRPGLRLDDALGEIEMLSGHLSYLHVFAWDHEANRYPLAVAQDYWRAVFDAFDRAASPDWPGPRTACLEFVHGDDPAQFERDAAVLRELLA